MPTSFNIDKGKLIGVNIYMPHDDRSVNSVNYDKLVN